MTVFEATRKVLQENGGGPLHYREIARLAIEKGYMTTTGITPWFTVHAMLRTHIKETAELREDALIVQTGPGMFALAKQAKRGIVKDIAEANMKVKEQLLGNCMKLIQGHLKNS